MKFTNGSIVGTLNALATMADIEFPVQVAYAIKKNHRKLVAEYKDYEEQLEVLKEKYPERDKSKEYMSDLQTLLDIEVDIDIHKLDESVFTNGVFNITAKQLEIMEFMIETE